MLISCSKKNEIAFNGVFLNNGELANVTTALVTNITDTSAFLVGELINKGNSTGLFLGFCYNNQPSPTIENHFTSATFHLGEFSANISGLKGNTKYYARAYAISNLGTSYGEQIEFKTESVIPIIKTSLIKIYTFSTALVGGNVTSDGGETVTERGVYWGPTSNPESNGTKLQIGAGTGIFTVNLTGLAADTKYFIKAYAKNSIGTNYGDEITFSTYGVVTDLDYNNYNTIKIGSQIWMKENLKTTKYSDGTSIPNVINSNSWINLETSKTGAYCWYNNNINNKTTYGALYNFYAVEDTRKLCPSGWHVPNNNDWAELITYLGGDYYSGGKMKDTTLWDSPNAYATNSSSFTAFPGGMRSKYTSENNGFSKQGNTGYWWSSTLYNESQPWLYRLIFDDSYIYYYYTGKNWGASVRCIKD